MLYYSKLMLNLMYSVANRYKGLHINKPACIFKKLIFTQSLFNILLLQNDC